jgi:hypothetical protein
MVDYSQEEVVQFIRRNRTTDIKGRFELGVEEPGIGTDYTSQLTLQLLAFGLTPRLREVGMLVHILFPSLFYLPAEGLRLLQYKPAMQSTIKMAKSPYRTVIHHDIVTRTYNTWWCRPVGPFVRRIACIQISRNPSVT